MDVHQHLAYHDDQLLMSINIQNIVMTYNNIFFSIKSRWQESKDNIKDNL